MKLRNKGTEIIYDVPRSVGEGLIAAGIAVAVEFEVTKKPISTLQFAARDGVREGDFQHPPTVYYVCGTCGLKGHQESQRGTAHQTAIVRHCGVTETVPQNVADEYKRLFSQWKSKSRTPAAAPQVSAAVTDRRTLAWHGLKTREELVLAEQSAGFRAGNTFKIR